MAKEKSLPMTSEVKVVGHRGAAALAPENTLASFRKALEIGVDIIELDIHLTNDGRIVVIHDSNVKRTTNSKGEISELTLEEIKSLDAGSWFDASFENEQIPTLSEVLDLVNGQCKVLVEIKWPKSNIYKTIVPKMLDIFDEKNASSWVIVQSFEPKYLNQLSELTSEIEMHQLLFGFGDIVPIYYDRSLHWGKFIPVKGITSLNIFYIYLNKGFTNTLDENTSIGVFTVNKEKDILKSISLGAKFIISDNPDLVKSVISR